MSFRRPRPVAAEIDEQTQASATRAADELAASRRRFLTRAAAGGVIAVGASAVPLASMAPAFGQTTGSTPGSTPGSAPASASTALVKGEDLTWVVFTQGLELAAVDAYDAMVKSGRFLSAVAQNARDFGLHHKDAAIKLGEEAGSEAVTTPNATWAKQLTTQIDAAQTQIAMATVAYNLEEALAATYSLGLGLVGWETAKVFATISPVAAQQALTWSVVAQASDLEAWKAQITTYLPNFQTDTAALKPAQYPAS